MTDRTVDETNLQTPGYNYSVEGCMALELALKPWTEFDKDRRWKQGFVGVLDSEPVCTSLRGLKDNLDFVAVCCIVTAQVAENRLAAVEEKAVYRSQAAGGIEVVVAAGQGRCFVFGPGNNRLKLGEDSRLSAAGRAEKVFVPPQAVFERPWRTVRSSRSLSEIFR